MKVESAYFTYKYLIYHNAAPVCLSFLFFYNNDPPIRESGIQLDEANLIMTLGVHFFSETPGSVSLYLHGTHNLFLGRII